MFWLICFIIPTLICSYPCNSPAEWKWGESECSTYWLGGVIVVQIAFKTFTYHTHKTNASYLWEKHNTLKITTAWAVESTAFWTKQLLIRHILKSDYTNSCGCEGPFIFGSILSRCCMKRLQLAVVRKQRQVVWTSPDDPKGTILSGESAPSGGITLSKKIERSSPVIWFRQ